MNDRMKKKAKKSERKLVHQLLDVVLDINGLSRRDQEFTGNSPAAFLNFFGHIGIVEVRVHLNGWESGLDCDLRASAHTDRPKEVVKAISRLKKETPAAGTVRGENNKSTFIS